LNFDLMPSQDRFQIYRHGVVRAAARPIPELPRAIKTALFWNRP
jgi:hypothetical protein